MTKDQAFEEFMMQEIRDHGWVSPERYRRVFDAGYVAAVKAHDASGCPQIFADQSR